MKYFYHTLNSGNFELNVYISVSSKLADWKIVYKTIYMVVDVNNF